MSLPLSFCPSGSTVNIDLVAGRSTIIVGANGAGKTKLAIECERQIGETAHRIAAQRMLSLDPTIEKINERAARERLKHGSDNIAGYGGAEQTRQYVRWGNGGARFILDDAGMLLQVLFAEQANTSVGVNNALLEGRVEQGSPTLMHKLQSIFCRVLPTRELVISADDITVVSVIDGVRGTAYPMSEMSDGEKAVFYIIGQVLVADPGSVIIMDEPEIHVHRSILNRLWDEIEAARTDCAFLLITHELEFAASRTGSKLAINSYSPYTGWLIEEVPEASGFSEYLITLILGSRKPILFVEGEQDSLDLPLYRAVYPDWTIIARGSCENVIHSVTTLRANAALTRIQCSGVVDADSRSEEERSNLDRLGIAVLPVSEIENLLLLPTVSRAILKMNHFGDEEIEGRLARLKVALIADASDSTNVDPVVMRFCSRRLDRLLKRLDFSAQANVQELSAAFLASTSSFDIESLSLEVRSAIAAAVDRQDLPALLAVYDRKKALTALASSALCDLRVKHFESWVVRAIQSPSESFLREALRDALPVLAVP